MASLSEYKALFTQMTKREITERYKGSALGLLWSFITPLILLGVYTFVFGTLFNARWSGSATTADFAIILFAGLLMFQLFSDVVTRVPSLILSHTNLVKKVVFPLDILVPVVLGSAMFHACVSLVILLTATFFIQGYIPLTVFWLPVIFAPFLILLVGLGWMLAALGVYLRDIGQVMGTITTALLFLAPIFYPPDLIPSWVAPYIAFNPIVIPIEMLRDAAIFGRAPDPYHFAVYTAAAVIIASLGYSFFKHLRPGFADVL